MSTIPAGIFIAVYSALFELARHIVPVFFAGRKDWDIDNRNSLPRPVRAHRSARVVWLHAASLGEAKLLLRFLTTLEGRNPDDCYVTTATSKAGVEYLETMKRPSICAIGFLPFDTLPLMSSLITTFGVSRLWLLETELWPAMLWSCFRRKIPVGLVNARIEEKSFAAYSRLRWLFGSLLGQCDMVLAQNETYAKRFRLLGVKPERLHVVGNMKGHLLFQGAAPEKRRALRADLNIGEDDVVVTAGCFHKGEGAVLRECADTLTRRGRRVRYIIAPRYLDESDSLAREIGGSGLVRLTDIATQEPWDFLLIEKLGVLESLYSIADAAVVGGTFVDFGGHNVWEAAQYGIPVFFGPHHHTQVSSCDKLLAGGAGFCFKSGTGLADGLERTLWLEKARFAAAQSLFADEINRRQAIAEPLIP